MHTITDIEICTAGMDWRASTGVHAVTLENIADAVRAANDDPHVQVPRGKLGHYSDVNDGLPMWDPFAAVGDAAPAFGRFINLRATNDGAVLVGDAVDVPDWINASSYPSRSMESVPDVVTPGGKRYSMVVTAVAWLGEPLPAISDVEDLTTLLTEGPDALAASREETTVPQPTAASVSTSAIRDRFNYEWAPSEPIDGIDTYWWWVRDIRVDPNEVIADDDEGNLWSIPYSTDGADAVTFGEPAKVRETYVPVAAAAASIEATAPATQRVLATFSRPVKQDRPAAATAGPDNEENTMDEPVREFLVAQGIDPAAATEDQINAVNVYLAAGLTPPVAAKPAEDETDETDETPVAEVTAPETITVSQEVYDEQQRRLETLEAKDVERETVAATARRDTFADEMVTTGRITPAERALCRSNLDINEDATKAAYSALPASKVPVTRERTSTASSAATGEDALLAATRDRLGLTSKGA